MLKLTTGKMIDCSMTKEEIQKACDEADKLWSESGEAKNYTDPCDYCLNKCY